MTALLFVVAAFGGTLIRAAATGFEASFQRRMWATFAVNVAGAFLLGVLDGSDANVITTVGIGGLGALTTFSTFISQVECIDREGTRRDAAIYAAGTLLAGITAAALGIALPQRT
jgi:CrcB protein